MCATGVREVVAARFVVAGFQRVIRRHWTAPLRRANQLKT
jgi:hypothetical protein